MSPINPSVNNTEPSVLMPDIPVLIAKNGRFLWLGSDGEVEEPDQHKDIVSKLSSTPPLVCHAPSMANKLGLSGMNAFDCLELFAFIHPAKFCVPSPVGLAEFFHLNIPTSKTEEALTLINVTRLLLNDIKKGMISNSSDPKAILQAMPDWIWAPFVADALGIDISGPTQPNGLRIWKDLPEWSDHAPEPPPGHLPVTKKEAMAKLTASLQQMQRTPRPAQVDYIEKSLPAFSPRSEQGKPNVVMAEAGTGTGKTLAYLAPSQSWAEKNEGTVWVSTYTKNLQRQIDDELNKIYPDPILKRQKAVIRKGRENYLCLLNFEDMIKRASLPDNNKGKVMAGLLTRWVAASQNGDIKGGDLPGWIHDLMGRPRISSLTDRRGECIHAACPHYNKCFIEKAVRRSARADIVVANHALVLIQNALAGEFLDDVRQLPTRYVFDEAHHLFHAADSAFAIHLSGWETLELRRWILGNENTRSYRSGRSRGLKARVDELMNPKENTSEDTNKFLQAILFQARDLPSNGWLKRIQGNTPQGPVEEFLHQVRFHVLAKSSGRDQFYSIEAPKFDLPDGLIEKAKCLQTFLGKFKQATQQLRNVIEDQLNDVEEDDKNTEEKCRMEALSKSLKRRLLHSIEAWHGMLETLTSETPEQFYDWFSLDRHEGHEHDIGFYRHWVDPLSPFVKTIEPQAHGLLFTSATLTEGIQDEIENKQNAETMTGIPHFEKKVTPSWIQTPAPFDYKKQAKVFIVNDLDTRNTTRVATAYQQLFNASGGGALGLFTSIQKLKSVHTQLIQQWRAEYPLYAQHIDGMDISTLVDIFKAEENSCLLGTDAIRDGVDVPGKSLRLLIFDKMPWPKPSLLHKVRRQKFGARRYDELITRLKLKQAFGRLIRTNEDKGVFVMLESRLPTRLCDAFPADIEIERLPLNEVIQQIKKFL